MQLPGTSGDLVLAQSPPPNASQVAAPRTSLLVTETADPPSYVMPSFVGQPLGSASHTLQDAGFKLGNITMAPPPANANPTSPTTAESATVPATPSTPATPPQPTPASIIVVQTPPGGQKVLAGAVVNFEVR